MVESKQGGGGTGLGGNRLGKMKMATQKDRNDRVGNKAG